MTTASKDDRKARRLGKWISRAVRLLTWTLRYRIEDPHGYFDENRYRGDALIWLLWHNRILAMPAARQRFARHRQMVVLTSASRDGEILAEVCRRFGFGSVRGSSSRRGVAGLLGLHRHLAAATDVVITPDGPRGPRYQMAGGAVRLAASTSVPMIPVRLRYRRKLELNSWDRFQVPLPFSVVEVNFGEKSRVDPAALTSDEVMEAERLRFQALLGDQSPDQSLPSESDDDE